MEKKEAMKILKDFRDKSALFSVRTALDIIIPELKESEDEKVRKALIEMVHDTTGDELWGDYNVHKEDALAWLEKQSETFTKKDVDDAYLKGICDTKHEFEKKGGINETINRDELAQGVLKGAAINLITWIDYNAAEGNMCLSNMECKDIEDALISGNWDKIYSYIKKKLEKQSEQSNWKPSKEEMDVLYSLSYITNQYDDYKEEVITRLYQDLKREFFNGASYENMFPTNTNTEDNVRRRSTIQILEYARSLDNYNQYGKADIDKNIAWLEKQGEQHSPIDINKMVDEFAHTEVNGYGIPSMIEADAYHKGIEDTLEKQSEQEPVDKVEPKFKKESNDKVKQIPDKAVDALIKWLDTEQEDKKGGEK